MRVGWEERRDTTQTCRGTPSHTVRSRKRYDGDIDANAEAEAKLAALLKAPGAEAWLEQSRVVRHAVSNVQFGEGFVTLYRHPTVFGFVDLSSAPQHAALRRALGAARTSRSPARQSAACLLYTSPSPRD